MRWRGAAAILCVIAPLGGAELRVGTFRADVSPDVGEANLAARVKVVLDPLWAKGVVLDDGKTRYVVAAMDWCGVGGSTHLMFRQKMAQAAGTDVSRVMLQTVHQHAAPYVDADGHPLLDRLASPPPRMSDAFLERISSRLADAVRGAAANLQPFDRVGTSRVTVEKVASARRIFSGGKLFTRWSDGGKDPKMAALPEGDIDPWLRTITLARGTKPLVRLHFYATHPQTFCCDGRASADFVGAAREKREREEGVFQVYFTGCAGDVTVGKYNDGTLAAREALAGRMEKAMAASSEAVKFESAGALVWRYVPLQLERKPAPSLEGRRRAEVYEVAGAAAFAARKRPLDTASLALGRTTMLFLVGEPVLQYQRYAQEMGRGRFVAVAGYGDASPSYLVTDRNFTEGGYEPSSSNALPGTEARLKEVIRKLLGR